MSSRTEPTEMGDTAIVRVAALVPMRHESERVPRKNYRPLAGSPLFHHIVGSLLACPLIDQVVIDTDSRPIRESAAATFPTVLVLERPEHLRNGHIPMNEILLHDIDRVPADLYVQTHSTNPLLRPTTVTRAINRLLAARPDHDSLFSVTPRHVRLWSAAGQPLNHDPEQLQRTQDLEPILEENSSLYLFDAATLRARRSRIGARPLLFEIDPIEAWDIDEESDFRVAEVLLAHRDEWQR